MGTAAENVGHRSDSQKAGDEASIEVVWLERIARRDRAAFEELYREYGPRGFRFAVRLIRDETKAEEVTNDVRV